MRQAERSLRMAKVLAAGGFPEEAPDLIVRALRVVGGALMAMHDKLPAGASTATDADTRALVERAALPPETLAILDAIPLSAPAAPNDIEPLLSAAGRVLAVVGRNEPPLGNAIKPS